MFPAVFQDMGNFSCFQNLAQFSTLFFYKNTFWKQVLGLGIFSYNCLRVLIFLRKSETES